MTVLTFDLAVLLRLLWAFFGCELLKMPQEEIEKRELSDWEDINKLLQRHGFKPVKFADPLENKNLSDLVLLEKRTAADIRAMLRTMLADSDRRQALIQELIQSNTQLKEDVQLHQSCSVQHAQRARELEGVLDGVKAKVQELEDRYISKASQQHSIFQQLQQDKKQAESRCVELEQQLSREVEEAGHLQRKLSLAVREEERKQAQLNQTFQQLLKRPAKAHSPSDQRVLDVIEIYEAQLQQLRKDHEVSKELGGGDATTSQPEKESSDHFINTRALLKV